MEDSAYANWMEQSSSNKAAIAYAIAGAMIMSSVIMSVVGTFVVSAPSTPMLPQFAVQALEATGVVALIGGYLIFRNRRKQLEDNGQALTDPKYIPYLVVSYAVQEAATVIGLVLSITTGDKSWVQLFGIFTVFGLLSSLPKFQRNELSGP